MGDVVKATGVDREWIMGRCRKVRIATARSLFYYAARQERHRCRAIAEYMSRRYATVFLQARKFEDWLSVGDKRVVEWYNRYNSLQ